ncbi:hypothetical protein NBRC110019_29660 [Neptunitalea chrysea]|uniref:NfeD-like C-terminal domain-containing protein n=1 Tax=Neptunitalea chrysea TaxID=1647581 RepID=A0A9W6B8T2_9FLAO|nr:hypothetical protein [Neptunitalea chrysea]GLB53925.1 hypothetical protein NBRC110019_29660 [Neptunitalea chrysea]
MLNWYTELALFPKIYWTSAILGTFILLLLLVLTFIGGDSDDMGNADAEIDADNGIAFQFFTLKNTVGFFTLFGWSGLTCIDAALSKPVTIAVSTLCGLVMMSLMALIFHYMNKLSASGTLDYKNAINAVGEVYLTVGAKRSTIGKAHVRIQGALRELEALTDADTDLKSGTVIIVKKITPNGILIIDKLT